MASTKRRVVASPAAEVQRMADSDITRLIREAVAEDGVKWSNEKANKLFERVISEIFRVALLSGTFRFPAGYGTLKLRVHKATRRRIMDTVVEVPEQPYLRYVEGEAVRVALGKKDHYAPRRKRPVKSVI